MPDVKTEAKPKGWEKLRRDGGREPAEVGWDEDSRRHFHVNRNGSIEFHGRPEGVRVQQDGQGKSVFVPVGFGWADKEKTYLAPREEEPETAKQTAAPAASEEKG